MDHITDFFHQLANTIIEFVEEENNELTIVTNKGRVGDYATQVDINVENLIINTLHDNFPDDKILAEESHSDTPIPTDRIWLIDPICGTNNLGKGIKNYCTNIALVDKEKVIAACVIDHSQKQYIWSIGDDKVYVNSDVFVLPPEGIGQKIDVDFGSVRNAEISIQQKHNNLIQKLIQETSYDLISLNTSLAFAYTAIGKVDGFVNVFNHPWDIAAASFLIQQTGGKLTGIDGAPWTLTTVGAIAGRTPAIHNNILGPFLNS